MRRIEQLADVLTNGQTGNIPSRGLKQRRFVLTSGETMPYVSLVRLGGLVAILPAVAFGAAWAAAAEPPAATRSLDDQLLGDSGGQVDAEVDRQLFGDAGSAPNAAAAEQKKKTEDQRRIDAWNDLLKEELKAAAIDEMQNPLLGIARSMRLTEGLIDRTDSGQVTQKVQAEIVADLDKLSSRRRRSARLVPAHRRAPSGAKPTDRRNPAGRKGKPERQAVDHQQRETRQGGSQLGTWPGDRGDQAVWVNCRSNSAGNAPVVGRGILAEIRRPDRAILQTRLASDRKAAP